ncbi:MAG: hypothetical protein M1831_000964 [Alyxoria varia]|nr:MAG: hypothetical protein M1831_000964 [Alyxoria varia]
MALRQYAASSSPIPTLSYQAISRLQMFSKFVGVYYPTDQRNNPSLFCHYIELLPDALPRNQPLSSACAALSALQLGSSEGDQNVLMQGQQTYAKSLNQLGLALSHQTSANMDETFGTILVLGLCELFKTINHGEGGWIRHVNGGRQYLQKRGPKSIDTALSQSLFLNIRHASMFEGIMRREKVFFEEPVWQMVAHKIAQDDILIELVDIGVHIPTILEQVDRFNNEGPTILDAAEIFEIIGLGQERLKRWLQKHALAKGASRWELVDHRQVEGLGLLADDATFPKLYTFENFGGSHAFVLYNLFCTILVRTYLQFAQTLKDSEVQLNLFPDESIKESEELLVEQIRDLCRCCPFISRPNSAVAGHVIALFCTGYLRAILPELDLPEESAWVEKMSQNIAPKGLMEPMDCPPAGELYRMRTKRPSPIIEERQRLVRIRS